MAETRSATPRQVRQPAVVGAAEALDTATVVSEDVSAGAAASPALRDAPVTETIPVAASIVRLEPGLHALQVIAVDASSARPARVWLGRWPSDESEATVVLPAAESGDQWLPSATSVIAVRASKTGAFLIAAAFGSSSPPGIVARSIDAAMRSAAAAPIVGSPAPEPASDPAPDPSPGREIRTEVIVHIERVGDRVFTGSTWAGKPGDQQRIEGFSIRPLQEIQPNEIEYKALYAGGVETPWVSGPQFCGTRGRALPLTGLAIRVAPHVQDQFSVAYQASFFRSGITEPRSNGAPCLPKIPGDMLEGINIRIVQRHPG